MIRNYRKYLEPAYGEPLPEVAIDPPQKMDFVNPAVARHRMNMESICDLTALMRRTACYEPMMTIPITNTAVERDGYNIPVRIYHPDGEGPFPLMVFYHGGGWMMNNLDVYDYVPRYFAKFGGIAVVSVDYRLAPEWRFPTGVEDSYAALCWAAENAGSFKADGGNITVCGDSAGGNLAAVMCLLARDRGGPAIRSQVLIYPATIMRPTPRPVSEKRYGDGGYFIEINTEKGITPVYFENPDDADSPYASPLMADSLKGLPRAQFISAECDPILDQALMYAARLQDEGVEVDYKLYTGMIHAFINRPYRETFDAFDAMIRFIQAG